MLLNNFELIIKKDDQQQIQDLLDVGSDHDWWFTHNWFLLPKLVYKAQNSIYVYEGPFYKQNFHPYIQVILTLSRYFFLYLDLNHVHWRATLLTLVFFPTAQIFR